MILGDLNADPYDGDGDGDGDGTGRPVWCLLSSPRVTTAPISGSAGPSKPWRARAALTPSRSAIRGWMMLPTADCRLPTADCRLPTADFADGEGLSVGGLRAALAKSAHAGAEGFLPTAAGLLFAQAGDWPTASSHPHLVWADLASCLLACQLRAAIGD